MCEVFFFLLFLYSLRFFPTLSLKMLKLINVFTYVTLSSISQHNLLCMVEGSMVNLSSQESLFYCYTIIS